MRPRLGLDSARGDNSSDATKRKRVIMAKDTKADAPKLPKQRRSSTPEERVARLEAELKAAREKAEEKANRAANVAREQRAKLVERRDALNTKIAELTKIIGDENEPVNEGSEG